MTLCKSMMPIGNLLSWQIQAIAKVQENKLVKRCRIASSHYRIIASSHHRIIATACD
jgi:hypothetical protein